MKKEIVPMWRKLIIILDKTISRIIGLAILGSLAVWASRVAIDILSTPFSELSPLALLGGLFVGALAIFLIWLTISNFFAKYPSKFEK